MNVAIPILTVGPYSITVVSALLLYWNASLILSRFLTAFLVTMIAMKADTAFHLLYASCHHVAAALCRLRTVWDPQDVVHYFQTQSQFYLVVDITSIALLVGNELQFWSAALISRIALAALATRVEVAMRWWETQPATERVLTAVECIVCLAGCALQWAYYTLLPLEERGGSGFASLLMWYTSIVYIVAVGVRAYATLTTTLLRMGGYRVLCSLVHTVNPHDARAMEDSGLNPFSEVHDLYMGYFYAVACAVTAWYYAPSSLPVWMQCFVLLRFYLIATASGKLQRYKQMLDRFPSVTADPTKCCAICRDDFEDGEHVTCLPCGHTFHGSCVRSWLVRAATCPTCRQPVGSEGMARRSTAYDRTGTRFTGSVQPLAPRPSSGSAPPVSPAQTPGLYSETAPHPSTAAFAYQINEVPLPHLEALQRLERDRQTLRQQRGHLILQNTVTHASQVAGMAALPQPRGEAAPQQYQQAASVVEGAEDREGSPQPGSAKAPAAEEVDALLFTDTPFAPVAQEAAAPPHRQKRRRAEADGAEECQSSPDDGDSTAARRRTE